MAEFAQGLLAGFQFVEGLADRAERRQLLEERISLARSQDVRAQKRFDIGLEDRQTLIARQGNIDESNELLARAQRVGVENLQPFELEQLEEAAAFNPKIAGALAEFRTGQRDVEAITGLGGVTLQGVPQPQVTQQPSAPVTQTPSGQASEGFQTPFDVAAPQGGELPDPQVQPVQRTRFQFEQLLGVELPDELVIEQDRTQTTPVTQRINLPAGFVQDVLAAKELPVVEQEQTMKELREQVTGLPQRVSFERQAAAIADTDVTAWQAFADPDNTGGQALREMAATDPSIVTNKLHQDWNTIKERDPNLISTLSREMQPVVQKTIENSTAVLNQLPVNEQGLVDMTSREAKRAQRNFNNSLQLQQQMSDSFIPDIEARIRAGAMPIGNVELSADITNSLAETPTPGMPADNNQRRANMTVGQRAARSVMDGDARTLSTKQVQSLAWLTKRGYISAEGFQQFLTTGTFADPADIEFVSHDPDKILWRVDANGERAIVWMPTKLNGLTDAKDQFGEALDFMSTNIFVDPTGSDEGNAIQKQWQNEFLITLNQNPEILGLVGWASDDVSKLTPQHVAFLGERFKALKETQSDYENSFWARLPLTVNKLEDLVDENGNQIGFANFDDEARERGIDVPPFPSLQNDVRGTRLRLSTSDDAAARYMAIIASDQEIDNAITEAKTQALPDQ